MVINVIKGIDSMSKAHNVIFPTNPVVSDIQAQAYGGHGKKLSECQGMPRPLRPPRPHQQGSEI